MKIQTMATRLRNARMERGLTLEAVANASGMTPGRVWQLESGNFGAPRADKVFPLAKALKADAKALFGVEMVAQARSLQGRKAAAARAA